MESSHRLMLVYAIFLLAYSVLAFIAHAMLHEEVRREFSILLAVHGLAMTAWFTLYVAQAWAAATQAFALHRRVGRAAIALLTIVIVLAVAVTWVRSLATGNPALIVENITVNGLGAGGLLFLAFRAGFARRIEEHKRLMMVAMFALTSPAFGRLMVMLAVPPPVFIALFGLLGLAIPLAYDWLTMRHFHRTSWLAGGWHFTMVVAMTAVMMSPLSGELAEALARAGAT